MQQGSRVCPSVEVPVTQVARAEISIRSQRRRRRRERTLRDEVRS
jgi:hypothetical protein